jgi:hypothetical protein
MTKIKQSMRKTVHIESGGRTGRKPYEAPRLEKFGNISKLTAGVGGSNNDHGQNNMTKMGACL